MPATAPRLTTIIRQDLDTLPVGDAVLLSLRGKTVKSHLPTGRVDTINRLTKTTKTLLLDKPQTLTGEIWVFSGKDNYAYVKTKDSLWIDVSYLEMAPAPKGKDNTVWYVLGAIGLILALK